MKWQIFLADGGGSRKKFKGEKLKCKTVESAFRLRQVYDGTGWRIAVLFWIPGQARNDRMSGNDVRRRGLGWLRNGETKRCINYRRGCQYL